MVNTLGWVVGATTWPPSTTDPVPFAFQPLALKQVPLPAELQGVRNPVFLVDGEHLVFNTTMTGSTVPQIGLANVRTGEVKCITCSGGPELPGAGMLHPFPDGKRLFSGFYGVIECAPSILDCQSYTYLPYDLSNNMTPAHVSLGASPKLSPDGEHMGYSNIRKDGYEEMVVAKLVRQTDKYVIENPRVINPQGPSSLTDTSIESWSLGSALYELKTFTRGGGAVTYVQVGGAHSMNPDLWEVDLKTGVRTRLTASPDWDEDHGTSPDGQTLALWSNRTYHVFDWTGGMLPHRSFIDAPFVASMAGRLINSPGNLYCGGPMWLLPGTGDAGGTIVGQPIVNYKDPNVRVTDHVGGWPMWNSQSTRIALQATSAPGGGVYAKNTPPYVLVAELTAKKASAPLPIVSSEVGAWAPAPADYHPSFGYSGTLTFKGPGGGAVTVTYSPIVGILLGTWSQKFENYSEDGKTFLNGTQSVSVNKIGQAEVVITSNLTMTGEHTGSVIGNLTYHSPTASAPDSSATSTGSMTVTYDGTTVTGPPTWIDDPTDACPTSQQAKAPQLLAQTQSLPGGGYQIKVTASIAGAGQNQSSIDTRPVANALIKGGGEQVYTDANGVATISGSDSATQFRVTAGDTLTPTVFSLAR